MIQTVEITIIMTISKREGVRIRVMVFNSTFNKYVSYIVVVIFIGGGNRSTWRKPPTCSKSLINFIT